MNQSAKTTLKIFGIVTAIILIVIGLFVLASNWTVDGWVKYANESGASARKYMDSLTEEDIQIWSERTKEYLNKYNPAKSDIYPKEVPPELRQLGILGIHTDTNWVSYTWLGGMDHTELEVERMPDGHFRFTAYYNDESNRVIWPEIISSEDSQIK